MGILQCLTVMLPHCLELLGIHVASRDPDCSRLLHSELREGNMKEIDCRVVLDYNSLKAISINDDEN
jgi:hypothetical protein